MNRQQRRAQQSKRRGPADLVPSSMLTGPKDLPEDPEKDCLNAIVTSHIAAGRPENPKGEYVVRKEDAPKLIWKIIELVASKTAAAVDGDEKLPESERAGYIAKSLDEHLTDVTLQALVDEKWGVITTGKPHLSPDTIDQARAMIESLTYEKSKIQSHLLSVLATLDGWAIDALDDKSLAATFQKLKGEALVEYIEGSPVSDAVRDNAGFQETKEALINYGWRGATRSTFDRVLMRALGERIVYLGKKRKLETVLVSELSRLSSNEQKDAANRFRARLREEYDAINAARNFEERSGEKIDGIEEPEWPRLEKLRADLKAAREGGEVTSDLEATVDDLERRGEAWIAKKKEYAARSNELAAQTAPFPVESVRNFDFDLDLMRYGRDLWTEFLQDGSNEQGIRDEFAKHSKVSGDSRNESSAIVDTALFAAYWAKHAFQRLTTSHTFAAALMCTDADRSALESIQRQWDAFMVVVPNGMLSISGMAKNSGTTGNFEYDRIFVRVSPETGEAVIMLIERARLPIVNNCIAVAGDTLADALTASNSNPNDPTGRSERLVRMGLRLVAGLLLSLQDASNFKSRTVPYRSPRPGAKGIARHGEPEHRFITVGKPLTIDCRPAVRSYIDEGIGRRTACGKGGGPPTVQTLVRGHYRRQVCGVGRLQRKTIWISPFWRGPEEAVILVRTKVTEKEEKRT